MGSVPSRPRISRQTASLQASSGRDYITKGQLAVGSKQAVCIKSRHEPIYASEEENGEYMCQLLPNNPLWGHHNIDAAGKPSRMERYGERASVMIGKKN